MKMSEVKKMSDKELDKKLDTTRTLLADKVREKFTNDEKNLHVKKNLRRDVARMLTEKKLRETDNKIEEKE